MKEQIYQLVKQGFITSHIGMILKNSCSMTHGYYVTVNKILRNHNSKVPHLHEDLPYD
ncbi:rCG47054 [Rattus norvegicus]|uniref:RCG47054 n=1 Tax=Rattus norvegicus TaxID=10116 RepID=A6KUN0_RAT|nr:rCG47054 [Rattus norvegicus]